MSDLRADIRAWLGNPDNVETLYEAAFSAIQAVALFRDGVARWRVQNKHAELAKRTTSDIALSPPRDAEELLLFIRKIERRLGRLGDEMDEVDAISQVPSISRDGMEQAVDGSDLITDALEAFRKIGVAIGRDRRVPECVVDVLTEELALMLPEKVTFAGHATAIEAAYRLAEDSIQRWSDPDRDPADPPPGVAPLRGMPKLLARLKRERGLLISHKPSTKAAAPLVPVVRAETPRPDGPDGAGYFWADGRSAKIRDGSFLPALWEAFIEGGGISIDIANQLVGDDGTGNQRKSHISSVRKTLRETGYKYEVKQERRVIYIRQNAANQGVARGSKI